MPIPILMSKIIFMKYLPPARPKLVPKLKMPSSYIINNDNKTNEEKVTCGVPQGSILGPLLFFIYVNDLPSASNLVNTIMFADDANLFLEHKDINVLFSTVNREL